MWKPLRHVVFAAGLLWSSTSASSCPLLSDSESPLIQSIAQLNGISSAQLAAIPINTLFAPVDNIAPWLSKCVANIDLRPVAVQLLTSANAQQCLQDLEGIPTSGFGFNDSSFSEVYCPAYENDVVPCLANVVLPIIDSAIASAGDCCSDFKSVVYASVGSSLTDNIGQLFKLVGNALCSTKGVVVDGQYSQQTCGYSLLSNFITEDEVHNPIDLATQLLAAWQVPSTDLCKAIEGQPFVTTLFQPAQFVNKEGAFGICYETVSALAQFVRSYPILHNIMIVTDSYNTVPLLSLFAENACIPGDALIRWLQADDGLFMRSIVVLQNLFVGLQLSAQSVDPTTSASSPSSHASSASASTSSDSSGWDWGFNTEEWFGSSTGTGDSTWTDTSAPTNAPVSPSSTSSNSGSTAAATTSQPDAYGDSLVNKVQYALGELIDVLKYTCIHIPTGVQCDYTSEWLYPAFSSS